MVSDEGSVRYAITNLAERWPGRDAAAREKRRSALRSDVRRWAAAGVAFAQLREKTLEAGEVYALAAEAMGWLREFGGTRLLVNGRADVAAAAGADGVHLTARMGELRPTQARTVFRAAGRRECVVSVSCHGLAEVAAVREGGADVILFGPVFAKRVGGEVVVAGVGLERLGQACELAGGVPVLALGEVTEAGVKACVKAGAAGVAGIGLFAG